MPKISLESERNIRLFLTVTFATPFIGVLLNPFLRSEYLTTVIYGGILIFWLLTIRRRIISDEMRHILTAGGLVLLSLFLLRVIRWEVLTYSPLASRYIWYGYHISYILIPLIFFISTLWVDKTDGKKYVHLTGLFMFIAVLLMILVMTNELHHLAFSDTAIPEEPDFRTYGPVYIAVILWTGILILSGLFRLLRLCQRSGSRRFWFVPVIAGLFAVMLMVVYVWHRGRVMLGGCRLYYLQEVNCFLYVGLWEACIQIGLIPSNTDYQYLFALADIDAILSDMQGNLVVRSGHNRERIPKKGRILVRRSHPVSGGSVTWTEDHTEIRRLNDRLRETTDELIGENELIEEENRIKANSAAVEEMHRLYEAIQASVADQLHMVGKLIGEIEEEERKQALKKSRGNLQKSLVYAVYVKRRANLVLLAEKADYLPLSELALCIRQSSE